MADAVARFPSTSTTPPLLEIMALVDRDESVILSVTYQLRLGTCSTKGSHPAGYPQGYHYLSQAIDYSSHTH